MLGFFIYTQGLFTTSVILKVYMENSRRLEVEKMRDSARAELVQLQERAAHIEAQLERESSLESGVAHDRSVDRAVGEVWQRSAQVPSPAILPRVSVHPQAFTLKLAPEEHDEKMGEILHVLQEKGVSSAIQYAEKVGNPHLIDDFHRVLVEWIHEGLPAPKINSSYGHALTLTLYEVTVSKIDKENERSSDPARAMHEFVSLMDQVYRSMHQMNANKGEYFSFEIANPAGNLQTSIYVAVPTARKSLFEKNLLSLYPHARLVERHDDYNAFFNGSATAAAEAYLTERPIYGLRTYEAFSSDPLDVLINSLSKLDAAHEGAAIQYIISPRDHGYLKRFRTALQKIHSGAPLWHATNVKTGFMGFVQDVSRAFSKPTVAAEHERVRPDDPRLKNIEHKISSPIFMGHIRVVASAATPIRAKTILEDIEAAFQQFADTSGNTIRFKEIPERKIKKFAELFSYRVPGSHPMPLSTTELATLAHLPGGDSKLAAPELRQEKSNVAPPPPELEHTGAVLGVNTFRGNTKEIYIAPEDRLRHMYVIGQTGTGKSTLLKNVILQDIRSGAGVCMIDPHGNDVLDILASVPPERIKDVIYFDPGETARPMGLNMLEFDPARPEQKTLVVDELLGIFKKLFGAVPESMGPAFEQYFRNAALLVMEAPELGSTLMDISRIFSDDDFRAKKLAACKNPIVLRFWQDIAMKTTGEQGLENYAPYVTNKFDAFTTNEIVRPIIAQQKSSFNFRDIMDSRKILLVNLAKGRIGDMNANLLGLVIVGKFLLAALSRADSVGKDLPPFYLHIDEFQNFTTPSIATIFSEARKYKLSLTVAHQFIAQLTDEIKDAVFGNVGTICAFRVGATDAEYLEKQFAPTFKQSDLMNVDNRNAYLKLLVKGRPATPFNIETLPFPDVQLEHVDRIRELSGLMYGRPRAEVEAEIAKTLSL